MLADLSEGILPRFVAAGWHPGRRVPVSDTIPTDHPAAAILATFGGLIVTPNREEGEECAPNDLTIGELRPGDPVVEGWGRLLKTRLVGVALIQGGHAELHVAADGRCFGRSCIHDAFSFEGQSFADAVERSLLGRRARPLLRPDQELVRLYGTVFTVESPGVYHY